MGRGARHHSTTLVASRWTTVTRCTWRTTPTTASASCPRAGWWQPSYATMERRRLTRPTASLCTGNPVARTTREGRSGSSSHLTTPTPSPPSPRMGTCPCWSAVARPNTATASARTPPSTRPMAWPSMRRAICTWLTLATTVSGWSHRRAKSPPWLAPATRRSPSRSSTRRAGCASACCRGTVPPCSSRTEPTRASDHFRWRLRRPRGSPPARSGRTCGGCVTATLARLSRARPSSR
mmetsp:Transcript_18449/g.60359  ORF Transcript_18449/g.60359 Transcript_18449/m.60359 type:complete len:237 (+) Transcript_18449:388-1098(+)